MTQTAPQEPHEHIRRPDLPWRVSTVTECGLPVNDLVAVIEREEFEAKVAEHGLSRRFYATCTPCFEAARRHPTWITDPIRTMGREFYGGHHSPRLLDELKALAALVEKHRDEFDDFMHDLAHTADLAVARRSRHRPTRRPGARQSS